MFRPPAKEQSIMTVWFITGASRGLGAEITRAALSRGHRVVAAARNAEHVRAGFPDAGAALLPVTLDVTDPAQIAAAVATAVETFGHIDVLVNNAGRGLLGAVEEATDEEIRSIYDVNVFAPLAVTRAVLPGMRAARSGTILNVSSAGGFVSAPGWGVYASTKFAMEGYTEALRDEVAPLGITVGLVEPGFFRTDFLDGTSLQISAGLSDYVEGPAADVRLATQSINHNQPGDPVRGAALIVAAVDSGEVPVRLFLGSDAIMYVSGKLEAVGREIERQRTAAASADHEAVAA
jgi:NAD(P)-dependent dehydrogenase (short-subunit alcohol dehydrogenase family)